MQCNLGRKLSTKTVTALSPHRDPEISHLSLPLVVLQQPWIRIHRRTRGPLHFGKSGEQRFDDPQRNFGVLYVATDIRGAFVETFLRNRTDRHVSLAALDERDVSEVLFPESLRLVDLTAHGLSRLGADARLTSGDYTASQRWALALYQHPEQPDGILYCSRHDLSCRCVAVFDRDRAGVSCSSLGSLTERRHRALLGRLLDLYDVRLI
jgi:hypothetical protein